MCKYAFIIAITVISIRGYSANYAYICTVQVRDTSGVPVSLYVVAEGKSDTITLSGVCYIPHSYPGLGGKGILYLMSFPEVDTIERIDEIKFRLIGKKNLFPSAVGPDTVLYEASIHGDITQDPNYIIQITDTTKAIPYGVAMKGPACEATIHIEGTDDEPIATSFWALMLVDARKLIWICMKCNYNSEEMFDQCPECNSTFVVDKTIDSIEFLIAIGHTDNSGNDSDVKFLPKNPWVIPICNKIHKIFICPLGRKLGAEHPGGLFDDVPMMKSIEANPSDAPNFKIRVNSGTRWRTYCIGNTSDILSFSYIVIADPHIGDKYDDYGTTGFNDRRLYTYQGMAAFRLKKIVESINHLIGSGNPYKIKFVLVLGDISESAERSEFMTAKKILDELKVPYIPIFGNHDTWPYYYKSDGKFVEEHPMETSKIGRRFSDNFDVVYREILPLHLPNWQISESYDPANTKYYFNFSFDYQRFHFIVSDWNVRHFAGWGRPGTGAPADLNKGNTWEWFWEKYDNVSYGTGEDKRKIIVAAHHPIRGIDYWFVEADFSTGELEQIVEKIKNRRGNTRINT
jgi:RNA polymerase subunit RPABC4/transcription elongation factor Spt4